MKKVSQRKAPGAIRAIALLVKPVRPSVACICGAVFASAINGLLVSQFKVNLLVGTIGFVLKDGAFYPEVHGKTHKDFA
jgi:hypothetical protein